MLEAVIGVQRGRNLHGPDQPEPEQDPADGVARLPARDEGPDDGERERGREEDVRRPERIGDGRRRRRPERRGEDAQRQPGARQRGEGPDGTDSPATRHGARTAVGTAVHVPIVRFRTPVVMGQGSRRGREHLAPRSASGQNRPRGREEILAVPEPSGRAVTWAREAADRFEAELTVFALDPADPDPAAAIVREAGEHGSDLIVLSDAGMRDRTEFLLANVANRVSHAARCSVVFVSDGSAPRASRARRASGCSAARPRSAGSSPATGCATTAPPPIARAGCARRSRSSARRSRSSARCSRRGPTCCRRSSSPSSRGCRTTCRRSRRPRSSPCSRPSSACRGRTRSRTSSRARSPPARSRRCTARACPTAPRSW